ncbi:hypothetical protein H0H10_14290 [Streptomyces sp. TRM S81-3]|uniref:Ornithine cyclodeaminase n=1 Tax=Streptomyces griseicoloratus TaxID=2752516 RepID=A0A926L0L3_9ACTN|nr:hypothetical protein [Streptomyces griseicoloratus]
MAVPVCEEGEGKIRRRAVRAARPAGRGWCGAAQGGRALFDASTGAVSTVLEDERHLSDLRTAAAGAVCARALSGPDATRATVLGTGRQAELQARALTLVRPVRQLHVWGRDHRRALALADRLGQDLPRRRHRGRRSGAGRAPVLSGPASATRTSVTSARSRRCRDHSCAPSNAVTTPRR